MRVPSSRSAWRTQFQIDCAVGSNSRDSESGVRPPRTRSTICCRYSGEYGGRLLGIVSSSPSLRVSTKPGQLQVSCHRGRAPSGLELSRGPREATCREDYRKGIRDNQS